MQGDPRMLGEPYQEQLVARDAKRARAEIDDQRHNAYDDPPKRRHVRLLPWRLAFVLLLVLITNAVYARGPVTLSAATAFLLLVSVVWGVATHLRSGD